MEHEKRGLCPYDDKQYLLADLFMAALIQTLTLTANVTYQRKNT